HELRRILMIKKLLVIFAFIGVVIIGGFALIFYVLPQIRINNLIRIPPNTKLVYETEDRWGANVGIQSDYYLSSTSINELSTWYKDFYPPFRPGNQQQEWLITAKRSDDTVINTDKDAVLGHESLCNYQYADGCVSVSMVDLTVQEPL